MERTWQITDSKGTRQVTLAEFKADIAARSAAAKPIMAALKRGDERAVEAAQTAFRKVYK